MTRLLLLLSVLALTSSAQEFITLRSGNGTPGGADSLITFLPGPFAAPLTSTEFAGADVGAPAQIIPPGSFGWQAYLATDPLSTWISTSQSSPSHTSALYAVPFFVSSPAVINATLSFALLVDEMIGDAVNVGLFVNGIPVPGTNSAGMANWANEGAINNLDVSAMVTPGQNTLYVNLINTAGPGGINFRADLVVAPQVEYQTNQLAGVLHVGAPGSAFLPAVATRCINETAPFFVNTINAGTGWDLAVSTLLPVPASGNGITLSDGQIVNVDPSSLVFLNSVGPFPDLLPFPGLISTVISSPVPVELGAQAFFVDPSLPLGVALTAPIGFRAVQSGLSSTFGPAGDNMSVSVDVTVPPFCWSVSGIPFYGSVYPSLSVSSNGRVSFGGSDDDQTPTLAEAMADDPFVGCWMDLAPNLGGAIAISSPAPEIVRVDWSAVAHVSQPGSTNSFGLEFNCATGDLIIDGLQGIAANPATAQFLGMSPGTAVGTATDPGMAAFAPTTSGAASSPSDMLYDFAASGPVGSLLPGNLDSIVFSPDGFGNYLWFAF